MNRIGLVQLSVALASAATPWPIAVDDLPCGYTVNDVPAKLVRGVVPMWLSGTLYRGQHAKVAFEPQSRFVGLPTGMMSLAFSGDGSPPTINFGLVHGSKWRGACDPSSATGKPYAGNCVVTVNQVGTPPQIVSVCATPALVPFDVAPGSPFRSSDSLVPLPWADASIPNGNPYGAACAPHCPVDLMPEHMPIDANGDVYGLYFTFAPISGYRLFKIPKGGSQRQQIAHVHSANAKTSYIHMGVSLSPKYIILIEAPLEHPVSYNDWSQFQKNLDVSKPVNVYVLDKHAGSGAVLAQ